MKNDFKKTDLQVNTILQTYKGNYVALLLLKEKLRAIVFQLQIIKFYHSFFLIIPMIAQIVPLLFSFSALLGIVNKSFSFFSCFDFKNFLTISFVFLPKWLNFCPNYAFY